MLTPRPRAHQPFAESIAVKLKPGLKSRLSTPTPPDLVTATIRELKPLIGETNRAVDVIADIVDQPGWQSGASVNGIVILSERSAVVVPEQSVVLRPAGERSEEHTSELQSLMRISYAVFCLKKKKKILASDIDTD